jgi:hypothetical protein
MVTMFQPNVADVRGESAWLGALVLSGAQFFAGALFPSVRPAMEPDTILARFARLHGLEPTQAAERFLLAAVPPSRRPLFRFLNRLVPAHFRPDRELVSEVLRARSTAEVKQAISYMHSRVRRSESFIRYTLGIRVSGQRLLTLTGQLFQP